MIWKIKLISNSRSPNYINFLEAIVKRRVRKAIALLLTRSVATSTNSLKNNAAAKSQAEIVYNSTNGKLFYNPNGKAAGFGGGGVFAYLTDEPTLSRSDFILQN